MEFNIVSGNIHSTHRENITVKRFAEYLGKKVKHDRVRESGELAKFGIRCRYLPDPPDIFDEYEFGIDFEKEQDRAFLVTVENGKIARMLFGATDPGNPDMLRPLSDADLEALLEKRGDALDGFFAYVVES